MFSVAHQYEIDTRAVETWIYLISLLCTAFYHILLILNVNESNIGEKLWELNIYEILLGKN